MQGWIIVHNYICCSRVTTVWGPSIISSVSFIKIAYQKWSYLSVIYVFFKDSCCSHTISIVCGGGGPPKCSNTCCFSMLLVAQIHISSKLTLKSSYSHTHTWSLNRVSITFIKVDVWWSKMNKILVVMQLYEHLVSYVLQKYINF